EGWTLFLSAGFRHASEGRRQWIWLCVASVLSLLALCAHPSGLAVVEYLHSLMGDRTILFIREWMPRPIFETMEDHWPLVLAALAALIASRRWPVLSGLLLLSTAVMARFAVRHETFFALAAAAVTLAELKHLEPWKRRLDALGRRPMVAVLVALTVLLLLTVKTQANYHRYAAQEYLYGYGAFDLAQGAVDFIEREHVAGSAFNTYGIGGYLLYRGYPQRKVFIDGRNVDYGFDFMMQTFIAGKDPEKWKELEDRYRLTVALVDYNVVRDEGDISYARHLDRNPAWALVYLDDWVAVYVKDIPEHADIIARNRYRHITPHLLESNTLAQTATGGHLPALESELIRVIEGNPSDIKGRVELAKLRLRGGDPAGARVLAEEVLHLQPMRPEPHALLAAVEGMEGRWDRAAEAILTAVRRAGANYPDLDYAAVAKILLKGGKPWLARWYAWRAGVPLPFETVAPPPAPAEASSSSSSSFDLNFEPDIEQALEDGIAAAEAGDIAAARAAFLRALMYDPSRPTTLSNLCALELQAHQLAKAGEYCEKALSGSPDFGEAHFNLALVFFERGDRAQAREHAEAAKRAGLETDALLQAIDRGI
ncbi:MAG: hypothetical protein PHS73_05065, partial [Candidatus Peribacteraceae bacterium]|nr:hypothetical protein [Candidatus Peribacteraceae bacterium]